MRYRCGALVALVCLAFGFGCIAPDPDLPEGLYAEIETDRGTMVALLEFERVPLAVTSFVGLAEGTLRASRNGRRFFDGMPFFGADQDSVQSGDPTGTGRGGAGFRFPDELRQDLRHDGPGVLSLVSSSADSNGSQFMITRRAMASLDGRNTVFGRVVRGQEVLALIEAGDLIRRVRILRVGDAARTFRADQRRFDALAAEVRETAERERRELLDLIAAQIRVKVPNAVTTDSGLMYSVIREGSGDTPRTGQTVRVIFTAMFLDGTEFDGSAQRGGPSLFRIGEGIPAWNEALPAMKRGEIRVLFVPPELAYGRAGLRDAIPPDSFLIFEVELVDF